MASHAATIYEKHTKHIVPVPDAKRIPSTPESKPLNAAMDQTDPMDLNEFGYLEEEYFVSGNANVYARFEYGEDIMVKVKDAPYTFRILVRKPADPKRFSGNVLVEIMNYAYKQDNPFTGWGEMDEYMLRSGDGWVGVTVRDVAVKTLKTFDPVRYAPLNCANPIPPEQRKEYVLTHEKYGKHPEMENGLMYDVLSQVAMLCRSGAAQSPFAGYDVQYLFATGASAGNLSAYSGSVHSYAMRDDKNYVYDGFLLQMTSSTAQLNNEEPGISVPDPRSTTRPCVPTMRVITMGDLFGVGFHRSWAIAQRRPDADEPGNRFRLYEVAGAKVGGRDDKLVSINKETALRAGFKDDMPGPVHEYRNYLFPIHYIQRCAFDNLKKWVRYGIQPPYAERMETKVGYPDGHPDKDFVLDDAGNVKGGVRSPMVDVPIATYEWGGNIRPFGREELVRRYGSKQAYLAKFARSLKETVEKRFILPEDAYELLSHMVNFDFGFEW
ncbi:hypothetical protein LJC63_10315 [Ruminococcaceae bacterium OttesenSCG-928-L11]|nr:hypothetical protein [Ruminococcaceae bacterium OttesenSCG-928-L11]